MSGADTELEAELDLALEEPEEGSLKAKLFEAKRTVRKLLKDKYSPTKFEIAFAFQEILGSGFVITVEDGMENQFTVTVAKEMEEFDFVVS